MSFGFSISDFTTCAQVVWEVYDALKTGPAECQTFAKEVLHFHQILVEVGESLRDKNCRLKSIDNQALWQLCRDSENLCSLIMDSHPSMTCLKYCDWLQSNRLSRMTLDAKYIDRHFALTETLSTTSLGIRQRIRTANFAKKIPKLQRAIAAHVEKLTAFNVLLIQSNQGHIQESQQRTESSQRRVESAQERLEESQARIEVQLKEILGLQHPQGTPLLSSSLDASSPEGRQTWMNLGRILRDEGITPAMIEKNQNLLIRVMKDTLDHEASIADSINESYRTALEYCIAGSENEVRNRSVFHGQGRFLVGPSTISERDSTTLFGSAPPSVAMFPSESLQRHLTDTDLLDHDANVASGMSSLLEEMSADNYKAHDLANDFTEAEELTDAEVATMIDDTEDFLSAPTRHPPKSRYILEKEAVLPVQYLYGQEHRRRELFKLCRASES